MILKQIVSPGCPSRQVSIVMTRYACSSMICIALKNYKTRAVALLPNLILPSEKLHSKGETDHATLFFLASCLKSLSYARLPYQDFPHNVMV